MLKKCLPFWKSLGTFTFLLHLIESGYKIPLFETLSAYTGKNNTSARQKATFVTLHAINELFLNNGIEKNQQLPSHSHSFITLYSTVWKAAPNSRSSTYMLTSAYTNKKSNVKILELLLA